MKLIKTATTIGILLCANLASAQSTVGPNSNFRWDISTFEVTESQISRFELRLDNGTWIDVGLVRVTNDPTTPPNNSTYEYPLATITTGLHTAQVRACNPVGCGPESNTVSFRMLALPGAPVLRLTQTIAVAGIIERNPYQLGNLSVIDVRIPEYGVTLNFGSPTWNIPGIYSAAVNDKVFLSLSK